MLETGLAAAPRSLQVVVAMIGVYLLEGSGSPPQWGDLWNLASAISFSLQVGDARRLGVQEWGRGRCCCSLCVTSGLVWAGLGEASGVPPGLRKLYLVSVAPVSS